jgi:beta-galactosidase
MGIVAEESFYLELFGKAADRAGLTRFTGLPEGVQISIRRKGNSNYLFLLNLTQKQQTVELKDAYRSLLQETSVGPDLCMDPYAVEIIELNEEFGGLANVETV